MNGLEAEANEVALIADELSRAVELNLNPTVDHESRSQAYNACESFKENSPWCAQAGLMLASGNQYSAVVRHFGLQLMEHTVKYRWTQITQAEKIFIKENAMKLLYMGGWDVGHLNDALARVIVEMVKREWPQQWPTLLSELSDACSRGHMHTQIVLHVFLRLVEDVATLQTLEQHQRRKDIYQALTGNMAEIFAFFMRLVELHVQQFREAQAAGQQPLASSHARVVQVVLLTLTGFVEWVSIIHVVTNNGRLLQILCILLEDDSFRLPAAECLLQIVNRKGSTKERKPLMILFNAEAVACLRRAALAALPASEEKHYLFLKKLSQVLAGLGQQLTSLWTYAQDCQAWLGELLDTLLLMTSHPSLTLAHTVNSVWLAFFKMDQRTLLGKMPSFLAVVPRWLQASAPKIVKVSFPNGRAGAAGAAGAAAYACMDYDSEQEFNMFFCRCRTEVLESFRHCMCIAPQMTWMFVEQWTNSALDKVDTCPPDIENSHPLYLEWEALSMVLDVVLSRLLVSEPRPDAASGLELLARCVAANPRAAALQSLLLSLVSALFVFLSCACSQLAGPQVGNAGAELLPRVLDKIFASLLTNEPEGQPRSRADKILRRHAASLLVKLASKYPLLLLPVFARLQAAARAAAARPAAGPVESVMLQEALLLVANHLCCYDRQSALVAQVLGDCSTRWAALGPHLTSGESLSRLIGLDRPPSEEEDEFARTRRTLLHALTLLLGVVRRTQVPDDPDKASRGGFGGGVTAAGNPVWRNPCAAHVLPLLPHVLALARALHELHAPPASTMRHVQHARALGLPRAEASNLLGLRGEGDGSAVRVDPAERMQNYIHALHDNVCHLVGAAAGSLGRELYSEPGLAAALRATVLGGLAALPDHWLRPVLRQALKPLLAHCPPAHAHTVALPLVDHVSVFMLEHLSARWQYVETLGAASQGPAREDEEAAQEVLEDMLVRHLTREYVDVLKVALVGGGLGGAGGREEASPGDMEEDAPASQRAPEQVSELGAVLLANAPAVLHTIFCALTWGDSTASLRACGLAGVAARAALEAGRLSAADAAGALAALLAALRRHGQHESNQHALLGAALQVYELARPVFPGVAGVLRGVPGADAADLQRLDDKLAAPAHKADKSRRDLFKKITARLIGRNVGQLFKKEVFIMDLPTMPSAAKDKPRPVVDSPEGASLEGLFASRAPT